MNQTPQQEQDLSHENNNHKIYSSSKPYMSKRENRNNNNFIGRSRSRDLNHRQTFNDYLHNNKKCNHQNNNYNNRKYKYNHYRHEITGHYYPRHYESKHDKEKYNTLIEIIP